MLQLLYGYIQHGLVYTYWQNTVHILVCVCAVCCHRQHSKVLTATLSVC